jgi:L-iditol 2-dehydrogenase
MRGGIFLKAAVFIGDKTIEVQDRKTLTPGKGEVLVEVKACGICGTDQHIYQGMPDLQL